MKRKICIFFTSSALIFTILLGTACTGKDKANNTYDNNKVKTEVANTTENKSKNKADVKTPRIEDDFYDNVNSKILKDKKIDKNGNGWDNFSSISEKTDEDIRKIAEETASNKNSDEGNAEHAVAAIYNSTKDKDAREKAGVGSLKEYIDSVQSSDSVESYLKAVAKIQKELGKSSIIPIEAFPDPKDSTKHALSFDEPIVMGKKEDFSSEDMKKDIKIYLEKLINSSGIASKDKKIDAKKIAEKVSNFQTEISESMYTKAEKNNIEKTMNFQTQEEIQSKISNMNVAEYLKESGMDGYQNFLITNPNMLSVINKNLTAENLETLKYYTITSLLDEYASYSNKSLSDAKASFEQMEGDEDSLALENVKNLTEMELGELYAKKHFSAEKKSNAENLVKNIIEGYRKHIETLDWMSPESKAEAVKKLDNMKYKIGYPEEYTSFVKGGIVKSPENGGTLIENAIAVSKAKAASNLNKATAPVDRNEWAISPQTVNGYYDHATNEVVIGAAMLQEPFYSENASHAKNLGRIGSVIAHEITHAFDDNGSHYDENGNLRNWWTESDREKFNQKTKDFVKYFGSFEAVPGHKVDGELTLGENIADLGGVNVISSMLSDDKEGLKEMYKSYANLWASKSSPDDIKDQLKSDEHAPAKIRVNAVLSSTDKFYEAFDIKQGDKMYVKPEDRVKMY